MLLVMIVSAAAAVVVLPVSFSYSFFSRSSTSWWINFSIVVWMTQSSDQREIHMKSACVGICMFCGKFKNAGNSFTQIPHENSTRSIVFGCQQGVGYGVSDWNLSRVKWQRIDNGKLSDVENVECWWFETKFQQHKQPTNCYSVISAKRFRFVSFHFCDFK